jgi:hypothetical protein
LNSLGGSNEVVQVAGGLVAWSQYLHDDPAGINDVGLVCGAAVSPAASVVAKSPTTVATTAKTTFTSGRRRSFAAAVVVADAAAFTWCIKRSSQASMC